MACCMVRSEGHSAFRTISEWAYQIKNTIAADGVSIHGLTYPLVVEVRIVAGFAAFSWAFVLFIFIIAVS